LERDAVLWVTAAEKTLGWSKGAFMSAYQANQKRSNGSILESAVIFPVIERLADQGWEGTSATLLLKIKVELGKGADTKNLPSNSAKLSSLLRRLAPNLRSERIDVQFSKTSGSGSSKIITIGRVPESIDAPDALPPSGVDQWRGVFED
jgi:hypothetical protein